MRRALQLIVTLALLGLAAVLFGARPSAEAVGPADQLEVILAIDTSGSMRPAIDAAKAAAGEFIAAMPVDVPIGVETFGDAVNVLTPPTTDRNLLTWAISGIVPGGHTALYDAVVTASTLFTPNVENKVLVLLSDGRDEGSAATLDQAVASVQGEHVEAISLTTAETDLAGLAALGPVTSADDPSGVSAAFARVANLLAVEVIPTTAVAPATTPAPTTTMSPTTSSAAVTTTAVTVASTSPAPAAPIETSSTKPSSARLLVGAGGIFGGLFLLVLLSFPRHRVSKARLGIAKPRRVSDMGTRTVSAVEEALERHGKRDALATALVVADISMDPAEFVALVAAVAIVAGLVGLLLAGPIVGLLIAFAICFVVRFHVRRIKTKRQSAFADQLPDVLQLVTTALRSGFGITQAIESVAEEAEEPARSEFAHVLVESRLGRSLSDSMRALAQRMESKDLDWVVSAIDINRETGGNLSEILSTVSGTIRERGTMARHVRTLTAEGRMSARILTGLPFAMALWQWRVNPDHFALLTHGAGLVALVFAGVLMLVGSAWVRKVVNSVVL